MDIVSFLRGLLLFIPESMMALVIFTIVIGAAGLVVWGLYESAPPQQKFLKSKGEVVLIKHIKGGYQYGQIMVSGEIWNFRSRDRFKVGEEAEISGFDGLLMIASKASKEGLPL